MAGNWILDLNSGDEVGVRANLKRGGDLRLGVVTGKGRSMVLVALEDEEWAFGINGIGVQSGWAGRRELVEITAEVREELRVMEMATHLSRINWKSLPAATLRQVSALLNGSGE